MNLDGEFDEHLKPSSGIHLGDLQKLIHFDLSFTSNVHLASTLYTHNLCILPNIIDKEFVIKGRDMT